MPVPISGESRTDFISRCVSKVIEDGTAEDGDQAIAICISMWDNRKGGNMEHEYKTFDFTVKDFDYEGRTVEGYAAAFGNVDLGSDMIHPGVFAKTLAERGNKVRFLWQHDQHEPIGRPIEMHEDTAGLFIKAIISDTARGRDALALLRDQAISGLSIGYDAMKGGTDYSKSDGGETIRNLRELRLWEFSLVSMPMNEMATVTALKTEDAPPEKSKVDELMERKQTLVETLRAALIEAEALLAGSPAPADNAGGDDDADDSPAGPTVQSPTAEETERVRLEILAQIESFEEETNGIHQI